MSAKAAAVMQALEGSVPEDGGQNTPESIGVPSAANAPSPVPTALAYVPHPGSGRVYFEPPGNGAGRPVTGYQISVDDGASWSRIQPSADCTWLPSLTPGHRCLVRVRAVTAAGPESASAPIEVVVGQTGVPATDQTRASASVEVIVLALVPSTRPANPPKGSDGPATGDQHHVVERHIYEYSLDGCRTWAPASPGQPLVLTRVNPDEPFALWLRPVG